MSNNLKLKNNNNKNIQINCIRKFIFLEKLEDIEVKKLYKIIAGEDGSIKILEKEIETYLPFAVDSSGWLIQIEDVYMLNPYSIFIVSSDGIIAHYKKIINQNNDNWSYKILLENEECYYQIIKVDIHQTKEAPSVAPLLSLYINTEFSGTVHLSFDLSSL